MSHRLLADLPPPVPRCIQINTDSSLLNSEFCFILKVRLWERPGLWVQVGAAGCGGCRVGLT